jgi:branched-chain amino acid transport system substrate-binding protein
MIRRFLRLIAALLAIRPCCVLLLVTLSAPVHASDGPIILGQSCALSGPAKNLGLEMRAGLLAAFARVNDLGGIKGRDIHLISLDDGYEPDKAVRNTQRLITEDDVFLLIGEVGTPTSKAVIPIIEQYRIPFFAPFSGAELLRTPFRRYVINVRASYYQEMEKLASYLVDQQKIKRISCFYQNDSYGFDGLNGLELALARRGLTLVSKGTYERNTLAVMGSFKDIYQGEPQAVVLVGAYPACAEFIKLSKNRIGPDLRFYNISFVGTESLQQALGAYGENVVVSQVVPNPVDDSIPLIQGVQGVDETLPARRPGDLHQPGRIYRRQVVRQNSSDCKGPIDQRVVYFCHAGDRYLRSGRHCAALRTEDHQGLDDTHLTAIYPVIVDLDIRHAGTPPQ